MVKIKNYIRVIIYSLIDLLTTPSKVIEPDTLLVIRLDAIGDYVLFRNYIEVLKKSEQYKDYKITLLGNGAWKSISEELDSEFVDKFIWLDRNRFNYDFFYRYQKLQEIVSFGYEIVVSPTYSREFFHTDAIVKSLYAKEKIGSIGDLSNIRKWQKNISDKYYTRLVPAKDELMFEFYRNKEFFEHLLNTSLDIRKPEINLMPKNIDMQIQSKYAVFFIGASAKSRQWNLQKFAEVARHIKQKYKYKIALCGGPMDKPNVREFSQHFKAELVDLVGKTTLVELLYIIDKADMMITNETSAPHFAVALNKKNIFVVSNGNHYGRFTPYPKEFTTEYHVIYHPEVTKDLNNHSKLCNRFGYGSELDISDIDTDDVIKKIDKVLLND